MKSLAKPPSRGVIKTIEVLSRTDNEAAVAVLLPALDSLVRTIQEGALEAILTRRSLVGQREIIRRMDTISERWHAIIDARHGRMTQTLRDALLNGDDHLCHNGCDAIIRFREYDLIPTLVNAVEDEGNPHGELATSTLLKLADLLYEELHSPRDYKLRRDPQLVRKNVTVSLEESTKRFAKHKQREPVEAFLLLAGRDNSTLMQILADPRHPSYLAVIHALQHSERTGIMRLILSYLDDPQAPTALVSVMVHRTDARFIELLLRKIGREPTAGAKTNLKHIASIAWLKDGPQGLDALDDAGQHSALQLVLASGMKSADQFAILQYLTSFGNAGGRRAAAEALATFKGAEATQLVNKCLRDSDPQVQATAIGQLRPRGVSGALGTLIKYLDHDNVVVRRAAQQNLPEYSFARYAAAYDALNEEVRRSAGMLVARVDAHAMASLRQEMKSNSGKRRMRAMSIARSMQVCANVEDALRDALKDPDHLVRVEVTYALGDCDTPTAHKALEEALDDSSLMVQEAAQQSLERIAARGASPAGNATESNHEGTLS